MPSDVTRLRAGLQLLQENLESSAVKKRLEIKALGEQVVECEEKAQRVAALLQVDDTALAAMLDLVAEVMAEEAA